MRRQLVVVIVTILSLIGIGEAQCPITIEYPGNERPETSPGLARFVVRNTTSDDVAMAYMKGYWQADGFPPTEYKFSGGPIPGGGQRLVQLPPSGPETQLLRSQPFRGIAVDRVEFTDHRTIASLASSCKSFLSPLQNMQKSRLQSAAGLLGKPAIVERPHPVLTGENLVVTRVDFDPNGKKKARTQLEFCGDREQPLREAQGWIIIEYTDSPQGCLALLGLRLYKNKSFLNSLPPVKPERCNAVWQNGEPGCGYREGPMPAETRNR